MLPTIKQSNEHNTICYFWSLATKKGVYAVEDNEFPSYNLSLTSVHLLSYAVLVDVST